MPLRPCLTCGALGTGSYCPRHVPKRASRQTPGRGGGADAARFRQAVLARAGHQCQFVNADGVRCSTTLGLQAHHVLPIAAGGDARDPDNGVALCRRHHEIAEWAARTAHL